MQFFLVYLGRFPPIESMQMGNMPPVTNWGELGREKAAQTLSVTETMKCGEREYAKETKACGPSPHLGWRNGTKPFSQIQTSL